MYTFETGQIKWDLNKMAHWFKDLTQKECEQCKWFPSCFGPCNKQLLTHKGRFICTFDAMNLDAKEYLMYSFKYHLLYVFKLKFTTASIVNLF